jgi:hypothetical protein
MRNKTTQRAIPSMGNGREARNKKENYRHTTTSNIPYLITSFNILCI